MEEKNHVVIIPTYKPAYVLKMKPLESMRELIGKKVGLKPKSIQCRINKENFRMIVPANTKGLTLNEKATSIADEDIKGYAMILVVENGAFIGMPKEVAQLITQRINEFNSEDIVDDVGA